MREMRRKKQLLSEELTVEILKNGSNGVLAVMGDEGYPYAVPVSYAYDDGKIYIHGAKTGHKIDAVRSNEKVSFCVVDKDENHPEELTTYFRSAIAFGKARISEDADELRCACELMAEKYSAVLPKERVEHEIEREWAALGVIVIEIEALTGKEAIELVRERKAK